jgi:hypothetical protein
MVVVVLLPLSSSMDNGEAVNNLRRYRRPFNGGGR